MFHKTIIAVTAAAALGCLPVSISALAADHPGDGRSGRQAVSGQRGHEADTPGADMLVAVTAHDTEVATTGARTDL